MDTLPEENKPEAPVLEMSSDRPIPESTSCMVCTADSRYLAMGHTQGLSVCSVETPDCAAEWQTDTQEITSVQMVSVSEETYLLATIDYMGVARIFGFHGDSIVLLSVLNVTDDVNKRTVCLRFELSQTGTCAAATMSWMSDVWVEVYYVPTEAWQTELEQYLAKVQRAADADKSSVEQRWSSITAVAKIRPPKKTAKVSTTERSLSFLTFSLSLDEDYVGPAAEDVEGNETEEVARHATYYFLLPCGHSPGAAQAYAQPGCPVSICLWWTGSRNFLFYDLQKSSKCKPESKSKLEEDPMPDMVWPNEKEILCTAVSRCTYYVALGLEDSLVSVWDRKTGAPLSVVLLTTADSALSRMHFVDHYPQDSAPSEEIHLLVACQGGSLHTISTGRGLESRTAKLSESPVDFEDLTTVTASVPFLQNMFVIIKKNGTILLQDVIKETVVCSLVPPEFQAIAATWNPVYALNKREKTLLIRGDQTVFDPLAESHSHILCLHFSEQDIFAPYVFTPADNIQQKPLDFDDLKEECNCYLQQRALTASERYDAIRQTWRDLQAMAGDAQ